MSLFRDILDKLFARQDLLPLDSGPKSDGGDAFSTMGSFYRTRMELGSSRIKRYKDFADMSEDALISGALDIYADESTQFDRHEGATVWVDTENVNVDRELRTLFDKVDIEEYIWGIARSLAQYGDYFLRPLASKSDGIVGFEQVDAEDVERVVDRHMQLVGFRINGFGEQLFDPWSFVHFRIVGRTQSVKKGGSLYGTSFLENTRRTFRMLSLLEDTLMIYRLEIGGKHRIFYVDVGGMPHEQALSTVRRYQRSFGKKEYFNPQDGTWTSRFNPLQLTSDIFWPIRRDSKSRIEYLGADPNVAAIADVDYFRDKMFASLRIPKAYLGGAEYSSVKYGLAQVDIAFARMTKRLQRSLVRGLTRLAQIHLAIREIDPRKAANKFRIVMPSPSSLDQAQRSETMMLSLDLAMKLKEVGNQVGLDPDGLDNYIRTVILGISPLDLKQAAYAADTGNSPVALTPRQISDSVLDLDRENTILSDEGWDGLALPPQGNRRKATLSSLDGLIPQHDETTDPFQVELSENQLDHLRPHLRSGGRPYHGIGESYYRSSRNPGNGFEPLG